MVSDGRAILNSVRVILEGGRSDTERLDLDLDRPPPYISRPGGERYDPVLDHHDQPMRDIADRWRYRLASPYRPMPHGYEAPRIKP